MKSSTQKCVAEGCNRFAKGRGLCDSHYQTARNWVIDGHGTWENLEKAGYSLPLNRKRSFSYGKNLRSVIPDISQKPIDDISPRGIEPPQSSPIIPAWDPNFDSVPDNKMPDSVLDIPPYKEYTENDDVEPV